MKPIDIDKYTKEELATKLAESVHLNQTQHQILLEAKSVAVHLAKSVPGMIWKISIAQAVVTLSCVGLWSYFNG